MSLLNTDVKYITSEMVGALPLTTTSGSLIAILDQFLTTGWGAQVPSASSALDGVLTLAFPSAFAAKLHSVVKVTYTGEHSFLSGEHKAVFAKDNTIKLLVPGLPDGAIAGITEVKMAPVGFNKVFSSTHVAAYQSSRPDSHGMFLRINDVSPNFARVVAYEVMQDINTASYPFPTNAQMVGGGYWDKAIQTWGGNTPYAIFSDGYSIIFCPAAGVAGGDPLLACSEAYFFGDTLEETPAGDPFATLLSCSPVQTNQQPSTQYEGLEKSHWLPRDRSGSVGAIEALVGDYVLRDFGSFPDRVSGKVHATKRYVCDANDPNVRAEVPGILNGLQSKVLHYHAPYSLIRIEGRLHMVIPSGGYDVSINDDACPVMYVDVTGPWLAPELSLEELAGDGAVTAFDNAMEP